MSRWTAGGKYLKNYNEMAFYMEFKTVGLHGRKTFNLTLLGHI
jgi:hypothetical protein